MSAINDGGSAFPIPLDDRPGAYSTEPGMTLRDYFAAKAMTKCIGLCSTVLLDAEEAYKIADAMLQARQS